MLAVMATYQGDLSELWETKYTDIRESYRTFCLKIDGSLVVSNEVTEPSVSDAFPCRNLQPIIHLPTVIVYREIRISHVKAGRTLEIRFLYFFLTGTE